MTRQLLEGTTTEAIESLAVTSTVVAGSVAGSSAIINTLISGSLASLWGMINSMQILVHMRIFNVQFPANANLVTKNIIMVATFDIPYVEVDFLLSPIGQLSDDDAPIDESEDGTDELNFKWQKIRY